MPQTTIASITRAKARAIMMPPLPPTAPPSTMIRPESSASRNMVLNWLVMRKLHNDMYTMFR